MVYSPDLMVLSYRVFVNLPGDKQGLDLDWVSVECPSKAAYGCGKHCESLIQGLSLSVRRLGCMDLGSSLSINLNSAALQSIQMEFGVTDGMMKSSRNSIPDVVANIQSAAEQVLVVYILFRLYQNHEERAYYLVYDATDASLYMIPCLPVYNHGPRLTMAPVPARPDGAQAHELTLTARAHFLVDRGDDGCRLCVCTPATRREESPSPGRGKTTGPWAVKMQRFPKKFPQNFRADLTFSLDDNVFWADLAQGVMYSSLRHSGPNADVVFVELPDGYRISLPKDNARVDLPLKMHRTMASFQGTIKFLCITGKMVKLWTLDLDLHMWIEDELLTCSWEELWTKACSKDARLSNVKPREPQYPVMMPDGELCLLLPKTRHKMGISVKRPDYICSFDMYIKTSLCLGRVRDYHLSKHFILPSGFFMDCSPAPLKRKPPTLKRKQPSVNEQGLQANTQEEATKRQ